MFLTTNSAAFATDIKASVTIKPSLSLNIPTNTIIMNLDPSTHTFDEKDLTIKVGTNNMYGYKLFVNTVNGTSDTNLVNIADNTKTIPNLSTSTTVSDFPVNQWGYRFTPNATSSSGNYGVFTPSDSTPIMESTEPVNEDTATMGFAAKIDYTKPSGQYELNLDFKALPIVTTNYMQDIASDPTLANTICTEEPTVVIDKRDEQAYTIRRINGTCWMVENLQFTGTELDSTTSNVAPEYTLANPYRVNNGSGYEDLSSGGSFDVAKLHSGEISVTITPIKDESVSSNISTVWYNYAAASAGTIAGNSNTNPQIYDICPAGWRLPNDAEGNAIKGTNYISAFSPVGGSYYAPDSLYPDRNEYGIWWMSNAYTSSVGGRNILGHVSTLYNAWFARTYGAYVRCVMKETNINNLTYMQDFAKLNESGNAAKKQQVMNSMETNVGYTLKDIRDSQDYTVSKLKDTKIWQINNLNLGANDISTNLTNANTNINSTISASTFNSWNRTSSGNTASYTAPKFSPVSSTNTDGVLYNYCAASANTYCYPDTDTADHGNAQYDLCPAGWRLPTGGAGGEFDALYTNYNSPTLIQASIEDGGAAFILAGYFNSGTPTQYGGNGIYWASTRYDATNMYRLQFNTTTVNQNNKNLRYYGYSIRCLVK